MTSVTKYMPPPKKFVSFKSVFEKNSSELSIKPFDPVLRWVYYGLGKNVSSGHLIFENWPNGPVEFFSFEPQSKL